MRNFRLELAATAALMITATPAFAQSASSGAKWFVPKAAVASTAEPVTAKAAPAQAAASTVQPGLPPMPALPQIPTVDAPPAAVVGVIDISGVVRSSTAYQAEQKDLQARKAKLDADAQAEQAKWREINQQITDDQKTKPADQVAAEQKQLQDRVSAAQKDFTARGQRMQDAANYADAQIQQVLGQITSQVARSHNMNLVIYQTQVVLSIRAFDISAEVAQELNHVLPSVLIPPDGADVAAFAVAHQAKAGK
jgi:Skp family chaperone for outer membrane proteins